MYKSVHHTYMDSLAFRIRTLKKQIGFSKFYFHFLKCFLCINNIPKKNVRSEMEYLYGKCFQMNATFVLEKKKLFTKVPKLKKPLANNK